MEQIYKNRFFWGLILIAVGIVLLLQNLNIFRLAWIGLLGLGGVLFFLAFLGNRSNWWAILPAGALLGLALAGGINAIWPGLGGRIGGAIFMIALAQSFWIVYLRDRNQWWAIIPCGTLLTIAAVALVETFLPRVETGGLFFLGLGATFGLVYLLPTHQGRMRWAIIPATALSAMGLLITFVNTWTLRKFWPMAIILVGGWLLVQALWPRKR